MLFITDCCFFIVFKIKTEELDVEKKIEEAAKKIERLAKFPASSLVRVNLYTSVENNFLDMSHLQGIASYLCKRTQQVFLTADCPESAVCYSIGTPREQTAAEPIVSVGEMALSSSFTKE